MTNRSVHTMPVRYDNSSPSPSRSSSRGHRILVGDDDNEAIWKRTFARTGTPASVRMESQRSRSRSRHGEVKTSTSASTGIKATTITRRQRSNSPNNNDVFDRKNSMNSSSKLTSSTKSSFREEKNSSGSSVPSSTTNNNRRGRELSSASSQYYDGSSSSARTKSRGRETTNNTFAVDNRTSSSSSARSKSRTRTIETTSNDDNNNTAARSTTPRPTKKLGCLGGSTDMTRRGDSNSNNSSTRSTTIGKSTSTPGRERTSSSTTTTTTPQQQSDVQEGVKLFEKQMKDERRVSQNEMMKNMNYGRAPSRGGGGESVNRMQGHQNNQQQQQQQQQQGGQQNHRGRTSNTTNDATGSSSRGRSRGRSQSRLMNNDDQQPPQPQPPSKSSRSISRHSRKNVAPCDPSCGSSPRKHRSKSRDPTTTRDNIGGERSRSKSKSRRIRDDDTKSVKSSKSLSSSTSKRRGASKGPKQQLQQQQRNNDDARSVYSSRSAAAKGLSSGMSIISRASAKGFSVLSGGRSVSGKSVRSGYSSEDSDESSLTPSTGPLSSYTGGSSSRGGMMMGAGNSVANNSYSSPRQQQHHRPRPATPNRTPAGSLHGADQSDIDEKEIMTYLFDRRGYCVRHPQVRLRKKKILGGWQTIITNCPECCVAEMNRLKRMGKKKKKDKQRRKEEQKKNSMQAMPEQQQQQQQMRTKDGSRVSSRSQSRRRNDDFADDAKSVRSSRSKSSRRSKSSKRSKSSSRKKQQQQQEQHHYSPQDGAPIFEFDIPVGEQSPLLSSSRSVKSGKSRKSATSRKSAKSTRSTRTNKSSRANKSSRSKSRQKNKQSDEGAGGNVVTRGSEKVSQHRFIRRGGTLRVAKMSYTDVHGREGKYTGDINEYGLPHGTGTMRYNNGTFYEGDDWLEGHSAKMDLGGALAQAGFSDWKSNTKLAQAEREKRKDREMDDLRSFISQSVRSGMTQSTGFHDPRMQPVGPMQIGGLKEQVHEMPWSDVNGYSGHYTGEVNDNDVPDGRGFMQYSNGVVEDGFFVNGVFQPPMPGMVVPQQQMYENQEQQMYGNQVPSSSMSVWSLKSTPTMAMGPSGNMIMPHHQGNPNGNASVMGAPSSVHMGGPSRQDPYANTQNRYS